MESLSLQPCSTVPGPTRAASAVVSSVEPCLLDGRGEVLLGMEFGRFHVLVERLSADVKSLVGRSLNLLTIEEAIHGDTGDTTEEAAGRCAGHSGARPHGDQCDAADVDAGSKEGLDDVPLGLQGVVRRRLGPQVACNLGICYRMSDDALDDSGVPGDGIDGHIRLAVE